MSGQRQGQRGAVAALASMPALQAHRDPRRNVAGRAGLRAAEGQKPLRHLEFEDPTMDSDDKAAAARRQPYGQDSKAGRVRLKARPSPGFHAKIGIELVALRTGQSGCFTGSSLLQNEQSGRRK
jgi:hypothetical protein